MIAWLFAATALATPWPGMDAGSGRLVEFEVPPGALPAGPAVARAELDRGAKVRHEVRFSVDPLVPTPVEVWVPWSMTADEQLHLAVTSEAGGAPWTTVVSAWETPEPILSGTVILGEPDELARLADVARAGADPRVDDVVGTMQLAPANAASDCPGLVQATLVVGVRAAEADALVACAARGARVLLVVPDAPAPIPVNRPTRWGRGVLAWTPSVDVGAGAVLQAMASPYAPSYGASLDYFSPPPSDDGSSVGPIAVLLLLIGYLVTIGVVGVIVGIRPRRPLVAWGWIPLVASGATLAAVGVALVWRAPPQVTVLTIDHRAPDGVGLRRVAVYVDAPYGRTFALDTPFDDATLGGLWPAGGFGSPFGSSVPVVDLVEDRVAGTLSARGLASQSYGQSAVGWLDPVGPADPGAAPLRVTPVRDDLVVVENTGDRDVVRGVVRVGGRGARLPPIAAGSRVEVVTEFALPTRDTYVPEEGWVDQLFYETEGSLADSVVVGVELAPADSGWTLTPRVATRQVDLAIVAGPSRGAL